VWFRVASWIVFINCYRRSRAADQSP
jgi:hypothetical protein